MGVERDARPRPADLAHALRALLRILLAAIVSLSAGVGPKLHAQETSEHAAAMGPAASTRATAPQGSRPTIEVFVRDGCPHCADAKAFLAQLQSERPDIEVRLQPVDTDAAARERLTALFQAAGQWPPGVPTFVIGERMLIGFDDAEHQGKELLALIDASATPSAAAIDRPQLGGMSVELLGLPAFTLALGLLDGFNPCAMWVLLFLLSLLVRLRDRRRMLLVAGTFVLTSAAIYYAFMAAWLNVFLAVGFSEPVRVGLALLALTIGAVNLKDFVAPGRGPSLSIPAASRPGLVALMARLRDTQALPALLLGVTVLAILVNLVELLCTAGLPAVYTAVLAQQGLSPAAHHAYLGLYILGYIADDSLMVGIAVAALGSGKLGERGGRRLKLLSGAVMLALGAVLLLRPQWLL
jgi:glutaredoxin